MLLIFTKILFLSTTPINGVCLFSFVPLIVQMAQVELRGINNRAEFVRRVQEAVKSKFPVHALFCISYSFLYHPQTQGGMRSPTKSKGDSSSLSQPIGFRFAKPGFWESKQQTKSPWPSDHTSMTLFTPVSPKKELSMISLDCNIRKKAIFPTIHFPSF